MNTENILFICGGSFEGIADIIARRVNQKVIGFGGEVLRSRQGDSFALLRQTQPDDLMRFGFIPEFVGRLPVIAPLEGLNEDALVRILQEPRNALVKQYRKVFGMENVDLEFSPEALRAVAEKAAARNTGARGLRSIMEALMLDLMFALPTLREQTNRIEITREIVDGEPHPLLFLQDSKEVA